MCPHSRDLASPCWQLDEGCCSLQACAGCGTCMALPGSAAHSALGNVVWLHHLDWVLLDITRLGLRLCPSYPGLLKLTRPPITM